MDANNVKSRSGVTIVYDGQCPFCTSYVKLVALRDRFGHVDLVDARTSSEWQERLAAEGLDLNEGFAVEYQERILCGSDALAFLAKSSRRDRFASRVNAILFSSPNIARVAYPILRAARNFTLAILGRQKL